jgi:hypothetical protein
MHLFSVPGKSCFTQRGAKTARKNQQTVENLPLHACKMWQSQGILHFKEV